MKRRDFVNSTVLATGSLFMLKCKAEDAAKNMNINKLKSIGNIGIQLWSVRHAMEENAVKTLKTLAQIGYTDIECTGYKEGQYYNMAPKEFKMVLDDLGLSMQSCHVKTGITTPEQTQTMTNDWERFCNHNAQMGAKSVVCGYFEEAERQTIDDYKKHAELFNKCGEVAKKYKLNFGHHNHDFEFFLIDNKVPYDILLNETDPNFVNFELDHYWIKKGGASSIDYINKHAGRFPVWHIKDMDDTKEQFFTEVGNGIIDYPSIFKNSEKAGLQYFYVEQDEFKNYKPLDGVKVSYNYLKKMKY